MLFLVGCQAPGLPDPAPLLAAWTRHVDPVVGVSLRIPPTWTLKDADSLKFGGADGEFQLYDWPGEETGAKLVAERLAWRGGNLFGSSVEATRVETTPVYLVTPRFGGQTGFAVANYPVPIKRTFAGRTANCVVLEADNSHLRQLAATLHVERSPVDYLDGTLNFMERYSFRRDSVDWPALRAKAHADAAPLAYIADAQRGIDSGLDTIDDHHSMLLPLRDSEDFFSPRATGTGFGAEHMDGALTIIRVFSGSPAAAAGVKLGDVLVGLQRTEAGIETLRLKTGTEAERTVTLTPANYATSLQPLYKRVVPGVGYLELPETVAADNYTPYQEALGAAISQGDREGATRWIIDLRRNNGGSHWAMIAPLAPLIGEGAFGGTENANGKRTIYAVHGNRVFEDATPIDPTFTPPTTTRSFPPVAVLTNRLSASAAEAVTLAFVGRPDARRFGTATLGVPTGNIAFELWDGAFLNLSTYRGLDRTGRAWDGPIPSDETAATRWDSYGEANDPSVAAALAWLATR